MRLYQWTRGSTQLVPAQKCASWLTKHHDDGSHLATTDRGSAGVVDTKAITMAVAKLT
jgi:hypothetical protein